MAITTTITPLEDEIINYSAQQQLQAAQQNALAGVDKSLAAGQVGYQNAVQDTNAAYDNIARQAYANYQTGQKGLANQLSSAGLYNTGYADTLRVQQANQYAANLNASEIERAKALRDLATEQEANRLNAEAQKLDIQAQYGQLLAGQANADRDFAFNQQQYADSRADAEWNKAQAEKEYADSRADVEWEREQYLKEAENAAQQQLISNAYNAAEIGDFSQLEALGIDTTAAKAAFAQSQRAALLDEAYAAAEMGDFSYLKALGVDTSGMEQKWRAELARALYASYGGGGSGGVSGSGTKKTDETTKKDFGELTGSEYNFAVTQADKLINNFVNQGKSYNDAVAHVEQARYAIVQQYGEDVYETYKNRVLNNYPQYEPYTEDDILADFEVLGIEDYEDAMEYAYGLSGNDQVLAIKLAAREFK